MPTVNLAEFTTSPGPRYRSEGPNSAEQWREEVLKPAFAEARRAQEKLHVNLDGVDGFASSFLEEALGGLVRTEMLVIECEDEPDVIERILGPLVP